MPRPMNLARKAARLARERFYQGAPCHRGHAIGGACQRYTSTNACVRCVAEQVRDDRRPINGVAL